MTPRWAIIIGGLVLVLTCIAGFRLSPGLKRTSAGRIIRFLTGQPMGVQVTEDLADDVIARSELSNLQQWSMDVLARYRSGQLATSGAASYWSAGTVKLAPAEIPPNVANVWREPPEISVLVSPTGQAECVAISWYLRGVVVGPPEYVLSFKPWCSKQAKPGVYAYHDYK